MVKFPNCPKTYVMVPPWNNHDSVLRTRESKFLLLRLQSWKWFSLLSLAWAKILLDLLHFLVGSLTSKFCLPRKFSFIFPVRRLNIKWRFWLVIWWRVSHWYICRQVGVKYHNSVCWQRFTRRQFTPISQQAVCSWSLFFLTSNRDKTV